MNVIICILCMIQCTSTYIVYICSPFHRVTGIWLYQLGTVYWSRQYAFNLSPSLPCFFLSLPSLLLTLLLSLSLSLAPPKYFKFLMSSKQLTHVTFSYNTIYYVENCALFPQRLRPNLLLKKFPVLQIGNYLPATVPFSSLV